MVRQSALGLVAALFLFSEPADADAPFASFQPIVEINSSDGDVGFHVLLSGGPYKWASVLDASRTRQINVRASDGLRRQGMSEFFLESAEPLCWNAPDAEPGAEIRTVRQFTERFPAGRYLAIGRDRDAELLYALADFTHNLPAAPVASAQVIETMNGVTVEITWQPGTDLGNCAYDDAAIPDPATVPVVLWEVAFEADVEDLPAGIDLPTKYLVQVPGDSRSLTVPSEFLTPWLDAGVTEYKFEIGAKEISGNQTFTEEALEINQ